MQNAPTALYELRRAWPTMKPQERDELRREFAAKLGLAGGPVGYGAPPMGPQYGYPQGAPQGGYASPYGGPQAGQYAPAAYGAPSPPPAYGSACPQAPPRGGADPYAGIPDPETRELMRKAFGDEPKRDTSSLVSEMNDAQKQGDDARAADLQLEIQKNQQESQVASQMLTNMMRMRYDSMKAVANNLH